MSTAVALSQRIVTCEQGTHDWFMARLGCVTSSRVASVIAKRKRVKEGQIAEELACRYDMRMELMCEMLTGSPTEHYVSRWMKEGKEKEPLARAEYELQMEVLVDQVGFIYHPTIKRAGISPDGLVGDDGLVEFKCPKIETHLQYLIDNVIPEEYVPQLYWQLACCEDRSYNDFVSYCPDVPQEYQIFRKRLGRTAEIDKIIRGMELEVSYFLEQVDETLARLKEARKGNI